MPHNYTKLEVAEVIDDFLNGRGGPYDFDDFCTFTITDPELDKIRERCADLQEEFPPEKPGQYCGSKGMDVLRVYVSQLRQQVRDEEARLVAPIKAPIIVAGGGVEVFGTLSDAITYIEPWDTEDTSPAYDSEGRLLRFFMSSELEEKGPPARRQVPSWMPAVIRPFAQRRLDRQQRFAEKFLGDLKITRVEALEQEPTHQREVHDALVQWLDSVYLSQYKRKKIDPPVSEEELSREPLEQLVSRVLEPDVKPWLTR
jgi:hypothetical protein